MKMLIALLFSILVALNMNAQLVFESIIKGNVQGPVKKVYLKTKQDGVTRMDSARVNNHQFQLKVIDKMPREAILTTDQHHEPLPLFLENGQYDIDVNAFQIQVIKAPETQQQYMVFVNLNKTTAILFPVYEKAKSENDSLKLKQLSFQFDSLRLLTAQTAKAFFSRNPRSSLALFLYEKFAPSSLDYSMNEPAYLQLPDWARQSTKGKDIAALIKGAKNTMIGKAAPHFSGKDTSGKFIALSDFRGSYLLIDFWASWCKPCRAENPNLIKAYQAYKDRGFEILGVSLEFPGDKENWKRAIEKDQLKWKQVSELTLFDDPVAILYGVQSIPQNFLVDPSGKLIAKNLHGDALLKKLEELLK